ncbi:hypothetical protein SmJEL517_g05377 [Synchytrium microbalum]|uniref:N-acetyltransferase domain-containing protein n=1 Tax=Synchytrium microbalum TaxID=1806994 RepID=A0A507BPG3_9FUNG|nr:uncharacterized protein SmJEL517_g05377 [Synchytrium microbalum]TPX31257.1 hypothetical protein SmJEL517_g05377 [Synchytrium microbalum]
MTTLRRFVADDLFKFNNINLDPLTETYNLSFYLQYLAEWPDYFVAAQSPSGELMGYIMGKSEGEGKLWHGHVTALTVAPEYRRLHLADRLMLILEQVSEKIKNAYFVDLFVRASNTVAIGMYEKFGYTVYRRVLGYYSGADGEDALDMRKALPRDVNKESIIPLKAPITPDELEDDSEFTRPNPKRHPQRTTIQHWQLRDLIACPTSRKEVICVNQTNVVSYDTENGKANYLFKDLTFPPTSMTTGCGYLAVGGQRSQLMVKKLGSDWAQQTTVGGSINNALSISNHLDGTRLLICNNDETIKIYSLPGLQRMASLTLPTAVNYASVSPDGRKLVAVGDSNQVFLYDISAGGYHKVAALTGSNDAGFSCAWNEGSEKFAVASQDGVVSVWDIRSPEKLAKIESKQSPQVKGACRGIKFAQAGSVDLLMFSEHVSYFNLVDTRTFEHRQSIRVAPPGSDQHISGVSFSPDAKSIFVGMENQIVEYEVDVMARRCFPEGRII